MPFPTDSVEIRPLQSGVPSDLGRPELPRSKSHAQRALLVGGLGAGELRITHLPDADDVVVMRAALEALGAAVVADGDGGVRVRAAAELRDGDVACADNGTALRTLLVAVALLGGDARFAAGAALRTRPLDAARALLAALGVEASTSWPLRLAARGALRLPTRLSVEAATTTQPASGALLGMACRARRGLPTVPVAILDARAAGYLAVTVEVLEALGFAVAMRREGANFELGVAATTRVVGEYEVPLDASAVAFPAALAVLHGRPAARVLGRLHTGRDQHPDWAVLLDLRRLQEAAPHATVELKDLGGRPDTFPALCVAAAGRAGTSVLRGAASLRGKESDRIATMAAGLRPLGVVCDELADGLVVHGRAEFTSDGGDALALPTPVDHRVVMALALLGTRRAGGVSIRNAQAVRKSWPRYFEWLARVATVTPTAS